MGPLEHSEHVWAPEENKEEVPTRLGAGGPDPAGEEGHDPAAGQRQMLQAAEVSRGGRRQLVFGEKQQNIRPPRHQDGLRAASHHCFCWSVDFTL